MFLKYLDLCVFAAVLLLSTSCYQIPQIKSPVPVPGRFSLAGQSQLVGGHWWRVLGDRQLDALMQRALQKSVDLKAAWARVKQSRAIARRTGAGLLPSISYNGRASGGVNERGFLGSAQVGLQASYEIDLWGRIRSLKKAADWDALASKEAYQATAITLSADLATTWFQWAEQRDQLALLSKQMKLNQQSLDLLTARFKLGQSGAADILQQRQLVESQRGEREQVLAQIKQLKHQLAVLSGAPPRTSLPSPTSRWDRLPGVPSVGIPAALIKRRPDIKRAFLQVKAAHHRVASAVADQFPQLTLTASGSGTAQTFTNLVGSWVASLAAGIVGPIFDGGRRSAEVQRTKAAAEEALQLYGRAILNALREVEDALARERHQKRLLVSQRKQLALADKVIQQTRLRYYNGAESFLRVLDAVRGQQTLQRQHLTAQRDLWLIRISLYRALAGGWKPVTSAKKGASQ